jgi:YgiT-type zinc finger domain-containing protein
MASHSDDLLTPPTGLDIVTDMAAWRVAHPHATLAEIEAALDDRIAALRSHLLSETVAASPLTDWSATPADQRPTCPQCGATLRPRGKRSRHLRTQGGLITLERTYGVCPACGTGVFPPRR